MTSKYRFKFSFVMPVYNVEAYLRDAIESVLAQTLDFKKNCEIIFINDGSTDSSEEICLYYKKLFPENIKYLKEERSGVSAARNRGIKDVEGKYISFLDSDDKISADSLYKVFSFFEKHYEDIDFVSIKMEYFGDTSGPHALNFKYDHDRVININNEFDHIQSSIGPVFVKSAAFSKGLIFDTRLKTLEDSKMLARLVLDKMGYGIVAEPVYYYRKRYKESAMGARWENLSWYFDTPKYGYKEMLLYSRKRVGYIPKYVQFLVMYHMQWQFMQTSQSILTDLQVKSYKKLLVDILQYIDDDVIIAQKNITPVYKNFILSKKHKEPVYSNSKLKDWRYFYNGIKIYDYKKFDIKLKVEDLQITGNNMSLEGFLRGTILPEVTIGFKVGGRLHTADIIDRPEKNVTFLDEVVYQGSGFKVNLPIKSGENIVPILILPNGLTRRLDIDESVKSRIPPFIAGKSYAARGAYLVCRTAPYKLVCVKNTLLRRAAKEIRYWFTIKDALANSLRFASALAGIMCKRRKIWLIYDINNYTGPLVHELYKYISKQHNGFQVYIVYDVRENTNKQLYQGTNGVLINSLRYKLLFVLSDVVTSSLKAENIIDSFDPHNGGRHIKDVLKFKMTPLPESKNDIYQIYQTVINANPDSYADKVVRHSLRFKWNRLSNKHQAKLKVFWWRYKYPSQLNFGDEVTTYIIASLWGLKCKYAPPDECDLASTGSIIEMLQNKSKDNQIKIWGSGFIQDGMSNHKNNLDFFAVRGPLSYARVSSMRPVVQGDPGLLVNLVFYRSKQVKYKVGIVAHYVDLDSPLLTVIKDDSTYFIINPLQPPDMVALDITSCEYVLSSSLHGLIFADSFGVPNNWMPLSDKLKGADYKFKDYYEATGRPVRKVSPEILNDKVKIDSAMKAYQPISGLKHIQKELIKSFPYNRRFI